MDASCIFPPEPFFAPLSRCELQVGDRQGSFLFRHTFTGADWLPVTTPSLVMEELLPETRPSPPWLFPLLGVPPLPFLLATPSRVQSTPPRLGDERTPPFARCSIHFFQLFCLSAHPSFQHQHTFCFVAEYPVSLFHPSSVYPLLPIDSYGRVAYLNEAPVIVFHTLLIPYYWTFGP